MGKPTVETSIPGAPAPSAPADPAPTPAAPAPPPAASAEELAAKDKEIADLRAALAAQAEANSAPALVMEADGPNSKRYKAESKHREYTTAQLDKLVRGGKVKLTDHHVLCKDGWYVNPNADREAREDLR